MSISGLVVHAQPEKVANVQEALLAIDGVEIHATTDEGRMVVTLDLPNDEQSAVTLYRIKDVEGVLNASLVYNYFDDSSVDSNQ